MVLSHLLNQLSDQLPISCPGCQQKSILPKQGLCESCQNRIPAPSNQCRRCGANLAEFVPTLEECFHCRETRFYSQRVVSLGTYAETLSQWCRQIKQPGGMSLAAGLTTLLWKHKQQFIQQWECDCIIPVPRYWVNRLDRGYHPVSVIADRLSDLSAISVSRHLVKKVIYTEKQSKLSPSERRKNLKSAFALSGNPDLTGAKILLVDDILTTGTTSQRIAKLLLDANAHSVHVAVIARGIGQ